MFVFVPAGFSDHYGRYLQYKSQIVRSLYPRSLFMYWRRSFTALQVAKPSAAALSKVAKPSGHCNLFIHPLAKFACCSLIIAYDLLYEVKKNPKIAWSAKEVPLCYLQLVCIIMVFTGRYRCKTWNLMHQSQRYKPGHNKLLYTWQNTEWHPARCSGPFELQEHFRPMP